MRLQVICKMTQLSSWTQGFELHSNKFRDLEVDSVLEVICIRTQVPPVVVCEFTKFRYAIPLEILKFATIGVN
jgi:hypothetical protein